MQFVESLVCLLDARIKERYNAALRAPCCCMLNVIHVGSRHTTRYFIVIFSICTFSLHTWERLRVTAIKSLFFFCQALKNINFFCLRFDIIIIPLHSNPMKFTHDFHSYYVHSLLENLRESRETFFHVEAVNNFRPHFSLFLFSEGGNSKFEVYRTISKVQ